MKPVKDFSGFWNPERRVIQFKWDAASIENNRFVYILGLQDDNGTYRIDPTLYKLFDICDMQNSSPNTTFLPVTNVKLGVYKMLFCAYSMPTAANLAPEDIIDACKNDPAFITTVIMGRANIQYVADTSTAENAKVIKVYLKSDSDIAQGVLGYRYPLDNCEIVLPFPANIHKGKTVFPPILIPKDSEIQIVPLDRQFSGNLSIECKKNKLLF